MHSTTLASINKSASDAMIGRKAREKSIMAKHMKTKNVLDSAFAAATDFATAVKKVLVSFSDMTLVTILASPISTFVSAEPYA